jgi:hypothetical protein
LVNTPFLLRITALPVFGFFTITPLFFFILSRMAAFNFSSPIKEYVSAISEYSPPISC